MGVGLSECRHKIISERQARVCRPHESDLWRAAWTYHAC
jgi:hypothetical protein